MAPPTMSAPRRRLPWLVAALVVLPMTPTLALFSACVLAAGLWFFDRMARGGVRRLRWLQDRPGDASAPPVG